MIRPPHAGERVNDDPPPPSTIFTHPMGDTMSVHALDRDTCLLLGAGLISLRSLGWGLPGLRTVRLGPDRGARRADALPWEVPTVQAQQAEQTAT